MVSPFGSAPVMPIPEAAPSPVLPSTPKPIPRAMYTTAALVSVLTLAAAFTPSFSKEVAAAGASTRTVVGEIASGWQARADDHIAGLSDPKTLSNPALVDYDQLFRATPESKRITKEGIDPNSAEGIQLTTAGQSRVRQACESVIASDGYCSIWKTISHSDGRSVSDATAAAKRVL